MAEPGANLVQFCAVGASAGGVMAIRALLAELDPSFTIPIGVVQHLPSSSRIDVAMIYSTGTRRVVEIEDKMPIEQGYVYMAPPGYHVLVERDGTFALTQDEPENYSRPSIDVFFDSVARVYGPRAVGVLLTGANSDGAKGLAKIGTDGGRTVAQDPEEAEVDTMPKSAIAIRKPDQILRLSAIADYLNGLEESSR
jgi:two-component system, chemotaxis family, protein-glutamate methylesterase/glutaminase